MKLRLSLLFVICVLVFSCSTDNDGDIMETDQTGMEDDGMVDDAMDDMDSNDDGSDDDMSSGVDLVGLWVLTELRIDETVDDDDLDFASDILDFLVAGECDLITFNFKDDGTVDSESKANFIEVGLGADGLEIPCPEQSDLETTLWSLDGDQLTFINDMQEEETITIVLEDEVTLIIAGQDIDENNYVGADAVFTKVVE
ncbi:hypothetical protein [Croceitalea rosinachiae]|uniref:Lipocalin-like domain-containing protein n=1 Tax=Croceitalea rosinachiae TaxID=3075596 RepID=A0ABU3A6B7_9FLAO|nr:hypothetical protein [Croceitalea sp. F388]MDT0605704.1 hypothetical protein [Croceitalea sp. F388]